MDTQRLILWLIFTFSAVMLWQAWEREKNPPAPATATAPAQRAGETAQQPAAGAPPVGVPAQAATGAPPASTAATAGQTIEVRTDLFVADIDSVGGTISRVALEKHRDGQDSAKPYLALQRNAERTFVAQAGLIGAAPALVTSNATSIT